MSWRRSLDSSSRQVCITCFCYTLTFILILMKQETRQSRSWPKHQIENSYSTQLINSYLMTTFRCPSAVSSLVTLCFEIFTTRFFSHSPERSIVPFSVDNCRFLSINFSNFCCCRHDTCLYSRSRAFSASVRMKEHRKEVDSFTASTQTRASRGRDNSVTHKSAVTDHAVEQNHVIDWDSAEVVAREAQRQTRWIKEVLWIRKTPTCMNRDAGSYQLSHTRDQVISGSREPARCKQSTRREQDVRRTSKRSH